MEFFWHLLFTVSNWIPLTLGYGFLLGKGKILHWGPVGVALVAAYSVFLTLEWTGSYAAALAVSLAVVAAVSLFSAWLALRLPGDSFGVLSIAVHLAALTVVLNWQSLTHGALGIARIPRMPLLESSSAFALAVAGVAAVSILLFLWVDKSPLGRALGALGEQPWHAGALGVRRSWVVCMAFLLLGLALWANNVFYPQYVRLLYPTDYQFSSFTFLLMVVVAGRPGSVWGVTLATTLLLLLREGVRFLPIEASLKGPLQLIVFGLILYAAVWVRRDSLFPKPRSV